MADLDTQFDGAPFGGSSFQTTHWSVVLSAKAGDGDQAGKALSQLCQTYWHALYGYVRRQGYPQQDAQDLIQGFFARLLEKQDLVDADRAKGRFRSFLLIS